MPLHPNPIHVLCLRIYYDWYTSTNEGIKPVIDGVQGQALKKIIAYLNAMEVIKSGKYKVEDSWKAILENWEKLPERDQPYRKLTQISSNIAEIICKIKKNGQQQKANRYSEAQRILYGNS